MAYDDYAEISDLRSEGLSDSVVNDTKAEELLLLANQLVEKITKQFFIEKTGSIAFDGNNTRLLHLPFPVHTVTSLYLNENDTALDSSYYTVYDKRGGSDIIDHRKNPKVVLNNNGRDSIYTKLDNRHFYKGYDTTITGTWGYVESDGSVPISIKRAVISIVMVHSKDLFDLYSAGQMSMEPATGGLRRERTDDHEMEYYQSPQHTKNYILPLSIQNVLMQYRAPNKVVTTNMRWIGDV